MAMKGNVYDAARSLGKKTEVALEDQVASRGDNDRQHPSARPRKKPKSMSMAPNEGNKRSHYGRPFE
jgi:hypothetical protein